MGYERDDHRYGRDRGYGRGRDEDRSSGYGGQSYGRSGERYGPQRDREYGRGDPGRYGRPPQDYDYDDRGFFDRAGDEVRSWFGDEEAERRRRFDERYAEREYESRYGRDADRGMSSRGDYGRYGQGDRDRGADRAGYGRGETGGYSDYGMGGGAGYPGFGGQGAGVGFNPSGDYGAGRGAGATSDYGMGAGRNRDLWGDPQYHSWRERQVADLDRDYDEYRRENQTKFESDFGAWRSTRQTQRGSMGKVTEHQEVVGSDGKHVGTVDKVRGDRIILTKADKDAGGHHHSIPCSWLTEVTDKVTISKTADEAKAHWRDEENNSAFGYGDQDRARSDQDGPHTLDRSFSGTYRR